jgi:crossover junction endodeoxyribonuclease RusA
VITLRLPYPPSANRYWETRVIKVKATGKWMSMTYVSKGAKAYKEEVAWLAKAAGIRKPFEGRVAIDIKLYPQRPQDWEKRARANPDTWDDDVRCIDLDNARKVLYDAFKGVVIIDDKWVRKDSGERMEPDGAARVVVTITPLVLVKSQSELL